MDTGSLEWKIDIGMTERGIKPFLDAVDTKTFFWRPERLVTPAIALVNYSFSSSSSEEETFPSSDGSRFGNQPNSARSTDSSPMASRCTVTPSASRAAA